METLRILIVEDNAEDLQTFQDTVDRYNDQGSIHVEPIVCKSIDETYEIMDSSFDGAIVDLRLNGSADAGTEVVRHIEKSGWRIPVAIFTGTPTAVNRDFTYIEVFTKGGVGYDDILDRFLEIYNTGLTRIMGGRGMIEKKLSMIFRKNLIPQINTWVDYSKKDSLYDEKVLLRHTINHLLHILDDDKIPHFSEEVYLKPPLTDKIRTGSIISQKEGDAKCYIVMTPACDLIIRNNDGFKTSHILLVEIETSNNLITKIIENRIKKEEEKENLNSKARQNLLKDLCKNSYAPYYHWLPETDCFPGGFLNFRRISTITKDDLGEYSLPPEIQISPSFMKDMIARFSSYYARQGQPNIANNATSSFMSKYNEFIKNYYQTLENAG